MTGVEVGVGVGKFSSTPTPARSRSRLQHFFITSFLVKMETKMETEHNVLTADSHDGLSCRVVLDSFFRADSTLTHIAIQVIQLRLNSNLKFANLTQL